LRAIRVFIFSWFTCFSVEAQISRVHVHGSVEAARPQELMLELRQTGGSVELYTAMPAISGQFDFRGIPAGVYLLTVKNQHGEVLKEEPVSLVSADTELPIRLVERAPSVPSGTVSLHRLAHRVPKAAQKAVQSYRKCRAKSDEPCALAALNEAIAADPESLEALVNRSALHARAHAWDLASADLEQALRLDPDCSLAHANRAFIAVHRQDYRQAAISARAALRSQPDSLNAQYLLGMAQVNLGEAQKGFRLLEKIAGEYEPARLALQQAAPQRERLARSLLPR